jgi:hypothetical protein
MFLSRTQVAHPACLSSVMTMTNMYNSSRNKKSEKQINFGFSLGAWSSVYEKPCGSLLQLFIDHSRRGLAVLTTNHMYNHDY